MYDYCFFLTRCLAFVLSHLFLTQHAVTVRRTDYGNVVISVLLYLKMEKSDFKKSFPILLDTTMSNFKKGYKTRRINMISQVHLDLETNASYISLQMVSERFLLIL